jgi:tetratricopeptide (TPR) repeat protein/transcriptional regulator with XRE-family HTH domain
VDDSRTARVPRFGELLRQHRIASGLSQEELAERSGLSVRAIANMERGRTTRPFSKSVRSLAAALELQSPLRDQLMRASRMIAADGSAPASPAGGSGAAPPSRPVPRQLPASVPQFVGRERELEELTSMLDDPDRGGTLVISAIAGTAGVGKTALAVHWAHRCAHRFPDGQLYINLQGYEPNEQMPAADALAAFLRALGVPSAEIPADLDERAALYRSQLATRRLLILLDNARDVAHVRPLLPGSPTCTVLVTSRDSLAGLIARDGAQRLALDVLPALEALALLRALIGARVDAEPRAAEALALLCACLPLALRIAAELAITRPVVPLADLVAELATRQLDLLQTYDDQYAGVRAVFSWSSRHLDAETARAFRLLGLHPGLDFDSYAAAALIGGGLAEARRLLDRLARACLVQVTASDRWNMHDLLRSYSRELCAAQDGTREQRLALTRLFDHYLHASSTAIDSLFPAEGSRRPRVRQPATPGPELAGEAALAWLDAERANLVAMAGHAAEHGWPGHAAQLAAILYRYLDVGGYFGEAADIHTQARQAAALAGDRDAEAEALTNLGVVELRQDRYEQATAYLNQALALRRQTGSKIGEARAVINLGVAAMRQDRYAEAVAYLNDAVGLYRATGDRVGEAHVLANLGGVHGALGLGEQAIDELQRSLALSREAGDRECEAYVTGELGNTELRMGRGAEAAGYFRQALRLCREHGNRTSEAETLTGLGSANLSSGAYESAGEHFRQALAICQEIGNRKGEASTLNGLGELLRVTGDPEAACAQHFAALTLAAAIGAPELEADAHRGLARAHRATGDMTRARRHWQRALELYDAIGTPEASQIRAELAAESAAGVS